MVRSWVLLSLICLLTASIAPVCAGTAAMQGSATTSAGMACGEDEVRACIQGSTVTVPDMAYGRIYGDGIYRIPEGGAGHSSTPNMDAGTYAVGMSDEYEWRGRNYSYVKLRNGFTTTCNIHVIATYEVRTQDGGTGGYPEIGQTFVSKGGSIQRITLWYPSVNATVAIRQGGPGGAVVGTTRTMNASGGASTVRWLWGDVPTVAGQTYYVGFTAGGFSAVAKSGNPYPNGQAYYNGAPQNADLMMSIFEDCDGQATMYNLPVGWSQTNNFMATEIGQTFKARGVNIMSVCLKLKTAGGNKIAQASILDGGPGGAQIGPTKAVFVKDYGDTGQKVTACWLPGEVPVTNGNTYYVKVYCAQQLYVWGAQGTGQYPDGDAYKDGVIFDNGKKADLLMTIMGEASPGSSTCSIHGTVRDCQGNIVPGATITADNCGYSTTSLADGAYSLVVTCDSYTLTCSKPSYQTQTVTGYNAACGTSPTLDWNICGIGRISGYVKYNGIGIPGATVTTNPGGYSATTQFSPLGYYAIDGVPAGTYAVTATACGFNPQTKTGIVVTPSGTASCYFDLTAAPQDRNLGFESGMNCWTNYASGLYAQYQQGYGNITPRSGNYFAMNAASWTNPKTGGAYQRVWAPLNSPFTASVYAACYGEGGGAAHTFSRIGVDPTGGADPAGGSVQWSAWYNSPQDGQWQWTPLSKSVTATTNWCTVFLDIKQESSGGGYAYQWQVNAFDDVAFQGPPLGTLAQAKQSSNGSYVYFGPAVIAAKFTGSPNYFYVRDLSVPTGIKVSGDTTYAVGDKVNVGGTISTANGERYITLSTVELVQSGYGAPKPLGLTNKALGGGPNGAVPGITGAKGLNNVGLLVKAWGRVTKIDSTNFKIADGSGVTANVIVPSGVTVPDTGTFACVTGISSVRYTGDMERLIRARYESDIVPR